MNSVLSKFKLQVCLKTSHARFFLLMFDLILALCQTQLCLMNKNTGQMKNSQSGKCRQTCGVHAESTR